MLGETLVEMLKLLNRLYGNEKLTFCIHQKRVVSYFFEGFKSKTLKSTEIDSRGSTYDL